ncbi:sigma-70 family RNA polymerase sigma factor [Spongiivirga sp. MCCC 1A20706]|uniref:RNA polymerase sigma factor n=1 Tax=Spongiivirga sp. MCCC 1A20706 TaxID=3160963 RepID=UPI0039772FEF
METTNQHIDHLFRREYGKIIAILVAKFGTNNIEYIEDAVQDSLIKAMQIWGYKEIPKNPTAWLLKVAKNTLVDALRKAARIQLKECKDFTNKTSKNEQDKEILDNAINDSQLKMIFACCHPSLSIDSQIILSLKLIGGFSNKEIARVVLKKEEAVAKSFTRAKKKLKQHIKTLKIPIEMGLQTRLFGVLRVVYLMFTEGYSATLGTQIIKKDFCYEAIRLALLLNKNDYCKHPDLHGLIALMCFHVARFEARIDDKGNLITLENQDREKYNRQLINIGIHHLEKSKPQGSPISNYQLEAAVSYYHCKAVRFEDTEWDSILSLYDAQLRRQYSRVVQLNRIIPFFKVNGARKALVQIKKYEESDYFEEDALYFAIKAELMIAMNSPETASKLLKNAIALTTNKMEKKHLEEKRRTLTS